MTHAGKYQLVSKLATGGMAEVFLAKAAGPMGFEKTLVLKRILPHLAEDPQFVEMFLGEAKLAARLDHPNVVQIFDFGEHEGAYFLAMEYIDGPNLRTLSRLARQNGVPMPISSCAKIISAACEGLAFAHDFTDPDTGEPLQLIHRDISPDNILLSGKGAVKVVDFGIAKAANQSHKTQTGLVKGKIAYMPPEQLQTLPLDRRVDVYALGVVLYELLTGQKPFDANTDVSMMQAILFEPLVPAVSRRPDLPRAMVQILERALAKVREHRYPDCRAFQSDLEHFILSTGEPVGPYQLAQLVAQVSGDAHGAVGTGPGSGPRSRPGAGSRPVSADAAHVRPRDEEHAGSREAEPTALSSGGRAGAGGQTRTALALATTLVSEKPLPEDAAHLEAEELALALPRRRTGMRVALGGLALLAAGGGVLFLRANSGAPRPPPLLAPVAAEKPATLEPEADAPARVALHDTSAPEPDTESPVEPPTPPSVAPSAPTKPPKPKRVAREETRSTPPPRRGAVVEKGKLEFRIRPYATVVLDGKQLGQTPLEPREVEVGMHTVQLINSALGKNITRTFEVKAGQPNVFKYNLLEN